jgi:saccharopine dehydrogenase-like NADP-dependent oxidoreductase
LKAINLQTKQKWMLAVLSVVLRDQEEFEDTKGVIIIRLSKKNRQHNGQKKTYRRTNNDLQNIRIKQKIEYHESH